MSDQEQLDRDSQHMQDELDTVQPDDELSAQELDEVIGGTGIVSPRDPQSGESDPPLSPNSLL